MPEALYGQRDNFHYPVATIIPPHTQPFQEKTKNWEQMLGGIETYKTPDGLATIENHENLLMESRKI